ncbi:DUF1684 domain-containing protein [Runella slithyformis]|uniref:DUF1684 domain-containing protein n=1 Tax=Runella slithyformis (strain ATCC 29530 / DSM 19594 / LMG 11500 / NCIMB 11436 / LSU 4) TaxID=761193 RepID=A0A7U3ZQT6_RUNSL|nr:DUF1684 domain-containing protein [Runella slithyformis]AEI51680.1 protein of unknown function DUF1684 [Runella slithyformis DSM 19594]
MNTIKFLFLLTICAAGTGFLSIRDDTGYVNELKAWHQKRIESLKAENGWLNLAGLFWLEEGKNSFGADTQNNVVFPAGKSLPLLGSFTLKNGEVWVDIEPGAKVTVNGQPVTSLKIFSAEDHPVLASGSLRWFVIKRGNKYGIRLRDLESPGIQHFTGINTYSIDQKWRVEARLEPAATDKKIPITDVTGQTSLQTSPGTLVFTIDGKEYRLDAVESEDQLFILFADKTSGKETYGAGRFLYAERPNRQGITVLDFNRSINPPCAFTTFATCPLPPKQNRLPIAVKAGEKNYGNH